MQLLESRGKIKATHNAKNCSTGILVPAAESPAPALMTSYLAQTRPGLKRKRAKYSLSAMSQLPWKQLGSRRDGEHREAGEELKGDPNGLSFPSMLVTFKPLLPYTAKVCLSLRQAPLGL